MTINKKRRALIGGTTIVALGAAIAVTVAVTSSSSASDKNGTSGVKKVTDRYHDVVNAKADGFTELKDKDGIACIDNPAGGMGIHYVNGKRVEDPAVTATEPELVIYEPQKNGKLKLVAVEYVVVKAAWEKSGNLRAPSLFGQDFTLVKEGNRYGLPDFYELHAWIWEKNKNGMFNDWNPKVSCAAA